MRTVLVIVPCGKAKVWDSEPGRGATPAREAYTGPPFKVNRRYAERFATEWRILSAKYGFIPPNSEIEPYDVSFKAPLSKPIRVEALQEQVRAQGLHRFETIVALGGKEYRAVVESALAPWGKKVLFPFAGLPLGAGMRAVNEAIERGAVLHQHG